jgi:hypothetical protein
MAALSLGAHNTSGLPPLACGSWVDGVVSLADSEHPGGAIPSVLGPIPYAYGPSGNENEPMDEDDLLHDPRAYVVHKVGGLAKSKGGSTMPPGKRHSHSFPWPDIANVSVLVSTVVDTGAAVSIYLLSCDDIL